MISRLWRKIKKKFFKKSGMIANFLPLEPVSRKFGSDRGLPIDRYYIENFLNENRVHIRGDVLEIADREYTKKFGSKVTTSHIMHIDSANKNANLIGDLSRPEDLPENQYDCFICTQTFQYIYDLHKGIAGAYRLLRPGGVLLATMPAISQKSIGEQDKWQDYWRFSRVGAETAFGLVFGLGNTRVEAHGNVYIAMAFLLGLAKEEVEQEKLDFKDPDYEVLITVKAQKPFSPNANT